MPSAAYTVDMSMSSDGWDESAVSRARNGRFAGDRKTGPEGGLLSSAQAPAVTQWLAHGLRPGMVFND